MHFFDDEALRIKSENYKGLRNEPKYQQHIKYMNNIFDNFIATVAITSIYANRSPKLKNNSLFVRSLEEFAESAIGTSLLLEEGIINPAIRELRYVLEASVKYLAVDRILINGSYEERLIYLHKHIPNSSIKPIEDIDIYYLDVEDVEDFRQNVTDLFTKLCRYVHPSKKQIEKYSKRELGFETPKEIQEFTRLLFRTYEIILVLMFCAIGPNLTGDLFVLLFDVQGNDWKFFKGKFISKVSSCYNYKSERKNK